MGAAFGSEFVVASAIKHWFAWAATAVRSLALVGRVGRGVNREGGARGHPLPDLESELRSTRGRNGKTASVGL